MSVISKDQYNTPVIPVGKSDKYIKCSGCNVMFSQQFTSCPKCSTANPSGATAI